VLHVVPLLLCHTQLLSLYFTNNHVTAEASPASVACGLCHTHLLSLHFTNNHVTAEASPASVACGLCHTHICCHFTSPTNMSMLWIIQLVFHVVPVLLCHTHLLSEKQRKEKTTPFGVNLMRSQILHRAAQVHLLSLHFTTNHVNAGAHPASVAHVPSLHMGQKSTQNNTKTKNHLYKLRHTHTHTHMHDIDCMWAVLRRAQTCCKERFLSSSELEECVSDSSWCTLARRATTSCWAACNSRASLSCTDTCFSQTGPHMGANGCLTRKGRHTFVGCMNG
jgi:hypothetical protein